MLSLKRSAPFFMILIFSLCNTLPCLASEKIIIFAPKKRQFTGIPVLFHIQAKNIIVPAKASLYYRPAGVSVFHRITMKKETPLDFRVLLKAEKIMPPGIEYFFTINDRYGHTFTFPEHNPEKTPYILKINLDRYPPHLVKTLPAKEKTLTEARPRIKIFFKDEETEVDTGSVRLFLDNTDVSQLASITKTEVSYQPGWAMNPGRHKISIEMNDICGNRMPVKSWYFTTAPIQADRKINADIQWDGALRYQTLSHENNQNPAWNLHSSATLTSALDSENFTTSLDANIWYTEEEGQGPQGDNFNLNHYLYRARSGNLSLEIGDVSVKGSELITSSIARRGGVVTMHAQATEIQGFVLRSNAVTGFDHIIGTDDPNQRLTGISVCRNIMGDKKLNIKTAYITGTNNEPANYNASSLEPGTQGNIYSLNATSELWEGKLKLEGEFSGTSYDSDTSDDLGRARGHAWFAKASGQGPSCSWETGVKYLGQDFHSVINATGTDNRAEYHAGIGWQALSSSFRLTGVRIIDNIEQDPLMPVIRNTTGTFSYNMAKAKWPAFFLNCSLNFQDSKHEPSSFSPVKNSTQTAGGGFSLAGSNWSISPSYTFMNFDDKSDTADNDSQTHVAIISGSASPAERFSINPSISYTRLHTNASDLTTQTWQGALGAF